MRSCLFYYKNRAVLNCDLFSNFWAFVLGGKYAVLKTGELYVFNAGPSDGYKSYSCRTVNKLTEETLSSTYPARIIITG